MFFSKALSMDDTLGNTFGSGIIGGITSALEGSSGINWNNVINQGFALASQGFNSFGGQTVGTQFASNPTRGGVFQIQGSNYDDGPRAGQMSPQMVAALAQAQANQNANKPPGSLGEGLDGIVKFLTSPVGLFVVVGGILLFMKPPARK